MAIDLTRAFELDEHGLKLFVDDTTSLSISASSDDPTVVGLTTPTGSLFLRTDGTLYIKTGALDTDWDIAATEAFVSGGFQPLDADLTALAGIATTGIYVITGPGTSTTRTIQGTTNRISLTFGDGVSGDPIVDIDAAYVGQTSIITLGTITTGTWHGTTIETTYGGTGLTSYATGDTLYASAPNVLSTLTIGASGTFLKSNGTIPGWATITGTDVTGAALTKVDDTNVTLTLGGLPATALLRATSLTLGWTGQLAVSRGGTNVSTFGGTNTLLYTTATDVLSSIPTVNTSALVTSNTGVPGWTSGSTANRVLRTNGTTITFAQVDLTTDVTGILPIGNGGTGTTGGALADPGGNGVVVRTALNTTTNRTITGTAARISVSNGSGVAGNPTIDIDATYVGQTSITTLGTITTGTWNGSTIGTTFGGTGLTSYAQGDLIYASAVNTLTQLAKDTNATRYLSNTGASNNPAWAQVNLTNGVTGTLPLGNGGTGQTTGLLLNNIIAATGSNSINNDDNAQTWNWALTTAAKTAFTFGENTAATNGVASQFLVEMSTLASSTAGPLRVSARGTPALLVNPLGNVVVSNAALATNATDGFLYIPTSAGTPTGVPTTFTGRAPIEVDTTNNLFYFYSTGAWRATSAALQLYKENPSSPTSPTTAGTNAVAIGNGATAPSVNSLGLGQGAAPRVQGGQALANGTFTGAGDAQKNEVMMRNSTTTATTTELFIDGTSIRMVLPNNSAYNFFISLVARRTDTTGGRAAYTFQGLIYRDANAASTAIQGTVTKTVLAESNAAWDANVDADTTNGSLRIQVNGEAAKTIRWVAYVRTTEVTN